MDDGLKQRLIGAVVLVLVAIIFIPMLFDDSKTRPEDILVNIPKKPDVPKLEIRQPERPSSPPSSTAKTAPTVPKPAAIPEKPANSPEKSVAEKRLAWTVQLASFAELKNAEALRDKLRKANYKSYIKYRPDKTPTLIQVFVGPELSRADVDRLKADLDAKFKLQGIVVRYDP